MIAIKSGKCFIVSGRLSDDRPLYVAVGNTLIGVVRLFGAGPGLIAYSFGIQSVLVVLIILALVAAGMCRALPEAHEMASYKTVRP